MTDSYTTVIDAARQELGVLGPPADSWMTDAQIEDRVLNHVMFTRQTNWQFLYVGATSAGLGRWIWSAHLNSSWSAVMGGNFSSVLAGLNRYTYLYGMTFTGTGGCTYMLNSSGSIQQLTGSADSTATYAVSGTVVAFQYIMRDLLNTMATKAAQIADETVGRGAGVMGGSVYEKINEMAAVWQGVSSA